MNFNAVQRLQCYFVTTKRSSFPNRMNTAPLKFSNFSWRFPNLNFRFCWRNTLITCKDTRSHSELQIRDKKNEHVVLYLVEKSAEGPAAVHSCVVHLVCCSTEKEKRNKQSCAQKWELDFWGLKHTSVTEKKNSKCKCGCGSEWRHN